MERTEILKVISGSPTDVTPVYDAIAERARVLCGASLGYTTRFDGKLLHLVGYRGVSARAQTVMREIHKKGPPENFGTPRAFPMFAWPDSSVPLRSKKRPGASSPASDSLHRRVSLLT